MPSASRSRFGADARAQEDGRGAIGAGAQHEETPCDLEYPVALEARQRDSPAAFNFEPVDERVREDGHVRVAAHGVEEREGGVPADVLAHVSVERGDPVGPRRITDVGDAADAGGNGGLEEGTLPGGEVLVGIGSRRHAPLDLAPDLDEFGRLPTPARAVFGRGAHDGALVMRRTAADDPRS